MTDPNTIRLIGGERTKEAFANAAINPGHLVELMSTGKVRANTKSSVLVPRTFALEKEYLGKEVTVAYAADDTVIYGVFAGGDEVAAKVAASASAIVIGDRLEAAGDGTVRKLSTADTLIATGVMKDDDSAASNGVAIYFHADEVYEAGEWIGHLESVTAGNASTYFDIGNGGPRVKVRDDDSAASGGFQVYYNQTDAKFYAAIPGGKDGFLMSSSGQFIRIYYNASPSSGNLAVYCDDDAANVYERLLFVSATNADGAFTTDNAVGLYTNVNAVQAIGIALEDVDNSAGSSEAFIRMQLL